MAATRQSKPSPGWCSSPCGPAGSQSGRHCHSKATAVSTIWLPPPDTLTALKLNGSAAIRAEYGSVRRRVERNGRGELEDRHRFAFSRGTVRRVLPEDGVVLRGRQRGDLGAGEHADLVGAEHHQLAGAQRGELRVGQSGDLGHRQAGELVGGQASNVGRRQRRHLCR